jgi:hypothetical protein
MWEVGCGRWEKPLTSDVAVRSGPRVAAESVEAVAIGDRDVDASQPEADDALGVGKSQPADDASGAVNEVVAAIGHSDHWERAISMKPSGVGRHPDRIGANCAAHG